MAVSPRLIPLRQRLSSEQGVYLTLTAIIFGVLVVGMGWMWFESFKVLEASTVLRMQVDILCRKVGPEAQFQREATADFVKYTKALAASGLLPSNTDITGATLIIPTMPKAFSGWMYGYTYDAQCGYGSAEATYDTCMPPGAEQDQPILSQLDISESAMGADGLPNSMCTGSIGCRFIGDVVVDRNSTTRLFPVMAWHNLAQAGNTVGCALEAKVKTPFVFWSTTQKIQATTMWSAPTYGGAQPSNYDNPGTTIDQTEGPFPGLTLAVGTEVATNSTDPNFAARHAPIDFSVGYDDVTPPAVLPPGNAFNIPEPVRTCSSTNCKVSKQNPGIPALSADPTQQTLAFEGCTSPLVQVRDNFVSALLELAARHGEMRGTTELLSISPIHANVDDLDRPVNPPVRLLDMTGEVAGRSTQPPAVSYVKANTGSPVWIDPWDQNNANNVPTRLADQVISDQLRMCRHIYRDDIFPRKPLNGITGANTGYEPDALGATPYSDEPYAFRSDLLDPTGNGLTQGRALSAMELGASLGAMQGCPFQVNCPGSPIGDGSGIGCCTLGTWLLPDVMGLLSYMDHLHNGTFVPLKTYDSPGGYSIFNNKKVATPFWEGGAFSQLHPDFSQTDRSAIVMVLHSPIIFGAPWTQDDLKAQYCALDGVEGCGETERPVTVAYFPDSCTTARTTDVFRYVFDIDPAEPKKNQIYIFAPSEYLQPGNDCTDSSTVESAKFRKYWADLLKDNGKAIVDKAKTVFRYRVLRVGSKF